MRGIESGNPFSEEEWIEFGNRCCIAREKLCDAIVLTQEKLGKSHKISTQTRRLAGSFDKFRCILDSWLLAFCPSELKTIGIDHIPPTRVFYGARSIIDHKPSKSQKSKQLCPETALLLSNLIEEMRDIVAFTRLNGVDEFVSTNKDHLSWIKVFIERLEKTSQFLE